MSKARKQDSSGSGFEGEGETGFIIDGFVLFLDLRLLLVHFGIEQGGLDLTFRLDVAGVGGAQFIEASGVFSPVERARLARADSILRWDDI